MKEGIGRLWELLGEKRTCDSGSSLEKSTLSVDSKESLPGNSRPFTYNGRRDIVVQHVRLDKALEGGSIGGCDEEVVFEGGLVQGWGGPLE